MAEAAPHGEALTEDDFAITCAGVPIALFNTAFVFGPMGAQDLRKRVERAREYFLGRSVPGCFVIPEPWLGAASGAMLTSFGMQASLRTTGMRAARLAPPARAIVPCDLRELRGDEAADALAQVNTEAYGMDSRAASVMCLPLLWRPPVRAYAVFEQERAVAVGAAAMLEGISYIMWMATLPHARRRGYAEAIIRRAVDDSAGAVSVLHATASGFPVYRRLGYEPVVEFPGYVYPAK